MPSRNATIRVVSSFGQEGGVDPAALLFARRVRVEAEPRRFGSSNGRRDRRIVLKPGARELFRMIEAKVTWLGPEVREVARVRADHARVDRREPVDAHRLVVEPGRHGEAHPRDLAKRACLLLCQAGIGIAAATGLHRVEDLRELVLQDPHRPDADREHVGNRHRRAEHVRDDAVPHAGRVLDRPDRAVRAA